MPTDTSNFTTPDVGGVNNGRQHTAKKWNPSVWNPQTQSMGAYVDTPLSATPSFESGSWGGRGNDVDENGNVVQGTSGADRDRDRFRLMGQTPTDKTGPQIDQSRSNETRDIGMGALGLLKQTADGSTPSAAERAGTQMSVDAQHGLTSAGQTVRGGAMARAAGARAATQAGGTVAAQQVQANAATRANEMANARGAYFGAVTGQRGQDLGIATDQAQLNQGQNTLNDQRENANEQLGYGVQASQLDHQLGRSEQDANAAQAAHQTSLAGSEAAYQRTRDMEKTIVGGAVGGVQAYDKATQDDGTDPDPDPTTGSSEEMKMNIRPMSRPRRNARSLVNDVEAARLSRQADEMLANSKAQQDAMLEAPASSGSKGRISDAEAARLSKQADEMLSKTEAQRAGMGLSTVNTPGNESAARGEAETPKARVRGRARGEGFDGPSGYDRSMFKAPQDNPDTQKLNAAIEDRVSHDNPRPGIVHEDPYGQPEPKPKERALFGGAHLGYAKERAGKPGAFGGPEAGYDLGDGYSDGWAAKPVVPDAPGTDDFNASSGRVKDPYSRAIMGLRSPGRFRAPGTAKIDLTTSDANAKKEAFIEGMVHARSEGKGEMPDYMKKEKPAGPFTRGIEDSKVTTAPPIGESPDITEVRTRMHPVASPSKNVFIHGADMDIAPRGKATPAQVAAQRKIDAETARIARAAAPPPAVPPVENPVAFSDEKTKFFGAPSKDPVFLKKDDAVRYSNDRDAKERAEAKKYASDKEQAAEAKRWVEGGKRDGAAVAFSDEKTKNGSDHEDRMAQANRSMAPYSYEYKPGFAEREGQKVGDKNVGPIAQNMKADPVASTVIVEDPDTGLLGIDKSKGLKLVMGGLADVQRQLDEVKSKKNRKRA